jgi:hypothetical protein
MRLSRFLLLPLATALLVSPALAADGDEPEVEEVEESSPLSITIDHSIGFNSEFDTLFTDHGVDFTFEGMVGSATVFADVWLGLYADHTTPEYSLDWLAEFGVSGERFGSIQWWDAGSAFTEACLDVAEGSANVGTEDLLAFGTCGGYTDGQSILYGSPALGPFTIYVSAMGDALGVIDIGEVDAAISAALYYEQTFGDVTVAADAGVDHAVSLAGGVPPGTMLPTSVHGGIAAAWNGWRVATAGQYEANSLAGGDSWGAGVGVGKEFEKLTLTAELAANGYEDAGVAIHEVSVGGTAEFTLIPDTLTVDAGANVMRRTGDMIDVTVFQVETGFEFSY